MKQISAAITCLFVLSAGTSSVRAQLNEWIWWGGSDSQLQPGSYGALGVPSSANSPGGREGAVTWTDQDGNFWMFGGLGLDSSGTLGNISIANGYLNDVWKYDPVTHQWTWSGGSNVFTYYPGSQFYGSPGVYGTVGQPDPANIPSGRLSAASWRDKDGNLWMFGGYGVSSSSSQAGYFGYLDDLWKYVASTGEWVWVEGSSTASASGLALAGVYGTMGVPAQANHPGGRREAATWVDNNGKFWMFGGLGFDSAGNVGSLNDLWEFDPASNVWAWMSGSSTQDQYGIYGTRRTAGAGNIPGGRRNAVTWVDDNGNLWLFGGSGLADQFQSVSTGNLNDLWKYDVSTKEWTWVNGEKFAYSDGLLGTLGVGSSITGPSNRSYATGWKDSAGNFWLFGGNSQVAAGVGGPDLNMLWVFKPSTMQWVWMGGDTGALLQNGQPGEPGHQGTLGVAAAGNIPAGRRLTAHWIDKNGSFWLFGGLGARWEEDNGFSFGYESNIADLWQFTPSATSLPPAVMPTLFPSLGTILGFSSPTLPISIFEQMSNANIHFTLDGTDPTIDSALYGGMGQVSWPGPITQAQITVKAFAVATGYPPSGVASRIYRIYPFTAAPSFSPDGNTYSTPQQVAMSSTTPGTTIYYTTNGASPTTSSNVYTNPITVDRNELLSAIAVAPQYGTSALYATSYTITPGFSLSADTASLKINQGSQGSVALSITPYSGFNSTVTFACSGLPAGATCSFNPAAITLSSGTVNATLTISAAARSAVLGVQSLHGTEFSALIFVGILGLLKRSRIKCTIVVLLLCGVAFATGCGAGNGASAGSTGSITPPTTSIVTVMATSGAVQQSLKVSLTLN